MVIESQYKATKVDVECFSMPFLAKHALELYDNFNQKDFLADITTIDAFVPMCNMIYQSFHKPLPKVSCISIEKKHIDADDGKNVVLGFSAGLDSVYQALLLKECGYNVHLFFAKNINTYENGQAWKYAQTIANKLNMDLIDASVKKDLRKGDNANAFRQHWPENPMKNQLIMSMMVDLCLERGWQYISLGDDFDLTLDMAVPGVNTTDAKEVTMSFLNGIKPYVEGLKFIPIPKGYDKGKRLVKIVSYGLENDYYSCVQSGRFNKSFRKRMEDKYSVQLFGNNCGCCRKCCMHDLILHYSGQKTFPDAFISHCWEKMHSTGCKADYEFFKPDLPLDKRIANLFSY